MRNKMTRKSESGFSLVELLMVLIISSMFVSMVVIFYNEYNIQKRIQKTDDNMKDSILQVSMTFPATLSYPCPANAALPPTDPNYLMELNATCNVRGLTLASGCVITPSGSVTSGPYNVNTCNGCTADGGLCVVPGARDINGDGTIGNDHREIVVIGALPVRSMRTQAGTTFSDEVASDGYGSLLTYAVSRSLAHDGQYVYYQGVISAVDEQGRPTAGIDNDGHYVIVSHGMNRQGAFSKEGVRSQACGLLGFDTENCDADATFMQAVVNSQADGLQYYDDKMTVSRSTSLKLWTNLGNTSSVRNLNRGNLAIDLSAPAGIAQNPTQLVHVGGDVRADGTVRANRLCYNPPGGNPDVTTDDICFDPGTFNALNECSGTNNLATRIDLSQPTVSGRLGCQTVTFAPVQNRNCGTGWVHAIRINGQVECLANPEPPPTEVGYVDIDDIVKPGDHTFSWEDTMYAVDMYSFGGSKSKSGEELYMFPEW